MIRVYGLGLLGYVTAASVASWGHVTNMMHDNSIPEIPDEPGLKAAIRREEKRGFLGYEHSTLKILQTDIAWLTYDAPLDAQCRADVEWINEQAHRVCDEQSKRTLVLVSSQVPVGFSTALQADFPHLRIASAPENIRRGKAMGDFSTQVPVLGLGEGTARADVQRIFGTDRKILVMSRESAELTKHLRNAYLAMCIEFANEGSRMSAATGASYEAVERALRADPRIGASAYIASGKADARHLLRDVHYLTEINATTLPLMEALLNAWVP